MSKRMKKKRILFEHIKTIGFVLDQALAVIEEQATEIAELRSVVERNAQATNARFDKLEKQVGNSNTKKPFWKR
ncbi:hypothetical protein [Streptococcus suis]